MLKISSTFLIVSMSLFMTFGQPQSYKDVFSNKLSNMQILDTLAEIIIEEPDNYFPYQSFISVYMVTENKPELKNWFKKNTFQYQYIRIMVLKMSGSRVKSEDFQYKPEMVPVNPLFYQDIIRSRLWMNPQIILDLPCHKALSTYLKAYYFGEKEEEDKALVSLFSIRESLPADTCYFVTKEYLGYLDNKGDSQDELLDVFEKFESRFIINQKLEYYSPAIYSLMAAFYHTRGNTDDEADMIDKGIHLSEYYRFNKILYRLYLKKAEIYSGMGNQKDALELIEKSRQYYESVSDYRNVISVMFTESLLYYDFGMYSKAGEVMESIEPLCLEYKQSSYAFLCGIMSLIKYELQDYDKAESYAEKALDYVKKYPNFNYESQAYASLINVYIKKGDFDKAEEIANERYQLSKDAGNVLTGKIFLYKLIDINIEKEAYCEALPFAEEADSLENNTSDSIILYSQLYEIYTKGRCTGLLPSLLSIYKRFPYIRKAKKLTSEVNIDDFHTIKEKYEFLRRKDSLRDEYADALEELTITIVWNIVLFFIALTIIIGLFQYIRKRRQNIIGSYRIKRILGEGGMGVVYLGHSMENNLPVAIKILKDSLQWNSVDIKRFKRESEILQKLHHTNIVNYVCSGEHNKKLYLAMEYIKGNTLREILNDQWPLPVNFSLQVVEQTLKALIYLHKEGILHRDIKPSNIIVNTGGSGSFSVNKNILEVKVMDFGLARSSDQSLLTQSSKMIGTPVYLAPEAISRGETNNQTDIYSFGILLYEMFAGTLPFHHHDTVALLYQVLHSEPKKLNNVLDSIPECVELLIEKCIARNPGDRYSSFEEVLGDFMICKEHLERNPDK